MHLKSLVLKGFKSFADRSVLAMEPGITAVVGPNGSGKSNISDAVLWVLGERNAKHLRGQAMEDVIFAGSSARKSVGIAEVDLVLDNSDGTLPVDFNEVCITRRMYRSGESEYLINGTVVRRMDVLDILHDSGLGTGTHSIISQGSLDSILQSKPEDRRAIIEEAAGVLKHKQRKAKSERKLAAMDNHLERVKDIVTEVQRQLGPLERKAKRAIQYQDATEELAKLTLVLAVDDLRALRKAWDDAVLKEQGLESQLEEKRAAIKATESCVEELQEKIRLENVGAGDLARRHRQAASAVERFDGAVLLLHEKRRQAQSVETQVKVTLESNKVKRASAQEEHDNAAATLLEVRLEKEKADAQVAQLQSELDRNVQQRRDMERAVEGLEKLKREQTRERERLRSELATTQESLSSGLAHMTLIEGHGKELELQLNRALSDSELKGKAADQEDSVLADMTQREAAARASVAQAHSDREAARNEVDKAREELALVNSEIKSLEKLERAAATAGSALAWLYEHAEEFNADTVSFAHHVRALPGSEALVEQLLGGDIAALLVADNQSAGRVGSALLESGKQGSVVLVPRKSATTQSSPARIAAAQGWGRALVDELEYTTEDAHAIESILGDVVVCPSRNAAFEAFEKASLPVRFVTEDGLVIWPNGKVAMGMLVADASDGVLARARRLAELRIAIQQAQTKREEAEARARGVEETMRDAQAASLKLSQELAEQRGKARALRNESNQAEEKLKSVRRELEGMEQRRKDAERSIAAARPSVEALEEKLAELTNTSEANIVRLEEIQEAVVPLRKQSAQIRDGLAEAKLKAATLTERETYASRIVETRIRDLEAIRMSDAASRKELLIKQETQRRIEPLLVIFDELILSARRWSRELEEATTVAQSSSSGLHNAINDARAQAREAQAGFDATNTALSEARVDKGKLEIQVERAVQVIVDDCKVPMDHALQLEELQERGLIEEAAFKLRRRISNMGTINPDAAQEYEQVKVRFDYLSAQLSDLNSARRSLEKIVRVIDARMKDDFIRTYEQVNKNFQEIFSVLFPGGSAHLTLVDPNDLEHTGVEVSAQPRGKRITKMMLMSGGEKSLTALALLFAVYRIRTTPFYILDEVEAALDDSNLRRLTEYLDTLRNSTQLIMITHQRRTMEMADVLFGVSMQADGVTKVVSQKLNREEK